jgi:phage recombination protein Bet
MTSVVTDKPATTGDLVLPEHRDLGTYRPDGTLLVPTPFGHLTFRAGQRVLTEEQLVLLAPLGVEPGWDPRVVAVFLLECHGREMDPWQREAYLMLYPGNKYIRHIGIDGFRKRGESTGAYRGRTTPLYSGDDEKWREVWPYRDRAPYAAKVGIDRADHRQIDYAIALYDEYVPMHDEWTGPQGKRVKTGRRLPTPAWRTAADGGKPTVMVGKCAEAQAWRVAFPARFGGFYAPEEFDRARAETPTDDPGAAARQAAYDAAHPDRERIVVDATVGTPTTDPGPLVDGMDDTTARDLLLAELDEQAEILGKTPADLCTRWSASRGGRDITTATPGELLAHVHRIRPYVLTELAGAGRDDEATRYAQAPAAGTCQDLFGRGPAVVEPPANVVTA